MLEKPSISGRIVIVTVVWWMKFTASLNGKFAEFVTIMYIRICARKL